MANEEAGLSAGSIGAGPESTTWPSVEEACETITGIPADTFTKLADRGEPPEWIRELTVGNYAGMPLEYVRSRRGKRGRPVSRDRIRRMEAIVDEVGRHEVAITARHLFYRLVSRGVIEKDEKAYERVLTDLLALRRSGDVAWDKITDGTRIKTRSIGYENLNDAVQQWQETYRRDIWRTNWAACEIWTESRGLLATINEVASEYGTPTLGVGGFNSASVGWETAQDVIRAVEHGQSYFIFHFGDYDPSGKLIGDTAERDIRVHLTDEQSDAFSFERIALTPDQIREFDLPSAPVKLKADGSIKSGHAKSWKGGATELDALDPVVLQQLVRESIESIIDRRQLDVLRVAEASERDALARFAEVAA